VEIIAYLIQLTAALTF